MVVGRRKRGGTNDVLLDICGWVWQRRSASLEYLRCSSTAVLCVAPRGGQQQDQRRREASRVERKEGSKNEPLRDGGRVLWWHVGTPSVLFVVKLYATLSSVFFAILCSLSVSSSNTHAHRSALSNSRPLNSRFSSTQSIRYLESVFEVERVLVERHRPRWSPVADDEGGVLSQQ